MFLDICRAQRRSPSPGVRAMLAVWPELDLFAATGVDPARATWHRTSDDLLAVVLAGRLTVELVHDGAVLTAGDVVIVPAFSHRRWEAGDDTAWLTGTHTGARLLTGHLTP